jgi:zinc protease
VLGEYNKSASSPFLKLEETMQDTAYTTHTYKHTVIGFLADIKDMPNQYRYSKVFFDRWYRPENCTIIVAGDVKHAALVAMVTQSYGGWKRGTARVDIPAEPPQTEPRAEQLSWPVPTLPILALGYHVPAADPSNPDTAALGALGQAMFGEASPFYDDLVLKQQKVVTITAEAEPRRDPGLFTILVRIRRSADLGYVRERINAALAQAAAVPIDRARLEAIKAHVRYDFAASLQSADDVAEAAGTAVAVTGSIDSINALYDAYDRLTPADLIRVARRYFKPSNETKITLLAENRK